MAFPASVDTFSAKVDHVTTIAAADVNALQTAVLALENYLITGPTDFVGRSFTATTGPYVSDFPAGATNILTNGESAVLYDKGGAFINVAGPKYRMIGTWDPVAGTGDATAAIAQALVDLGSAGGTLYFPAGIYMVTKSTPYFGAIGVVTSKIRLMGAGPSSIIRLAATAATGVRCVAVVSANDVEICYLQFDPNAVASSTGIFLDTTTRVNIHHNLFTNPVSGGVHPGVSTFDLTVTENIFNGAGYGLLTDDSAPNGGRWVISNNSFTGGATGDAIEINCPVNKVTDISIVGNRIANYTQVNPNAGFGIGVSGASRLNINGNNVNNCGRNGIHIDPDAVASDIIINGNVVSATGQAGIEVQAESGLVPSNIAITGNVVSGCCTNPLYNLGRAGIDCGSSTSGAAIGFGVKGLVIAGNLVEGTLNSKAGIYYQTGGSAAFPATITGNVCRFNGGNGIFIYSGQGCLASANRCRDNTLYGLRVDGSSAGFQAIGNDFTGNTGGAVNDVTAGGTFYRANPGLNPVGSTAPAVPASTVAQTVNFYDTDVYITAGASTVAVTVDGLAVLTLPINGVGMVRVPAGKQIILTYANAPTWKWYGN